ncbi:hypothetical protein B5X24_HaOG206792 [Helicoverpa armigera]|uniref:Uncharacterized protein n=1 Tax=Helicoverpa armigera TaxID=29058 RepID=A0A2W1BN60_HELAM|nr:hypothetical protein B5X24_HaOG206792 [Helicoverpa armigera]
MVSIVLLTTEEVLQRNGYWSCLDTVWITEELEPFEEVKPEHLYIKPLSRDYYYAKYPEIPRSESEDEHSLTLSGFQSKHSEWKSKVCVKRFDAQRRNSRQSHLSFNEVKARNSASFNKETRRATSWSEQYCCNNVPSTTRHNANTESIPSRNHDEKVRDFLNRLLESVPPPPIEELQDSSDDINACSIVEPPKEFVAFDDIEIPGYADFENDKILQTERGHSLLPATSTLKKSQRRVSFNLNTSRTEFESNESWYDSIYGISDLMLSASGENIIRDLDSFNASLNTGDQDNFPSWSEILMECEVNDSIVRSQDSTEEVISKSHCVDAQIQDLGSDDISDEETCYARFAIYKIHQTMKIQGHMVDSSPMKDLSEDDCNFTDKKLEDPYFFGAMYRLAPNSFEDIEELVNNRASST